MSLEISTDDFAKGIIKDLQSHTVRLANTAFYSIASLSPVKTGQFRASWNMSKDYPDYSTVDHGTGIGFPSAPTLRFRKNEFPKIFIANGKPYTSFLENGGSQQAPLGMVAITLAGLK